MKNIYLFGAGKRGRGVLSFLQTNAAEVNVIGYIDNKSKVDNIQGVKVISLSEADIDIPIIITVANRSNAYEEIKN